MSVSPGFIWRFHFFSWALYINFFKFRNKKQSLVAKFDHRGNASTYPCIILEEKSTFFLVKWGRTSFTSSLNRSNELTYITPFINVPFWRWPCIPKNYRDDFVSLVLVNSYFVQLWNIAKFCLYWGWISTRLPLRSIVSKCRTHLTDSFLNQGDHSKSKSLSLLICICLPITSSWIYSIVSNVVTSMEHPEHSSQSCLCDHIEM